MADNPTRIEAWEVRLNCVIESARTRRYVLGEWDCFRMTCAVMVALIGVDRWPEFCGYTSKREALKKLAHFGSSFEAAGDWFFGCDRSPVTMARRGDILALADHTGEKHLAVCVGANAAFMRPGGLDFLPLSSPALLCCWRIG